MHEAYLSKELFVIQLLHKFEVETAIVVDQLTAAQHSVEVAQRDRDHKVDYTTYLIGLILHTMDSFNVNYSVYSFMVKLTEYKLSCLVFWGKIDQISFDQLQGFYLVI